jgi:Leucine-rich repeat (LRR) protein
LTSNALTSLPAEIGLLFNLTTLGLCNNALTNLPAEIGNLTNLTILRLCNNDLINVPPEIGNLSNLITLDFFRNGLTNVPSDIGNLTSLTSLGLKRNELTSVPSEIGRLINLPMLSLSDNALKSIPAEIGNLTNLTTLSLSNNDLTSLPAEIGNLTNLTTLSLSSNDLTSLPAEIGNLNNLTFIDLSHNNLMNLPVEIGNLASLEYLELSFNNISNVPREIGTLTNLEILYLRGNQLSMLPLEITNLNNLIDGYFNCNALEISNTEINQFLKSKQKNWQRTQTVSPEQLTITTKTTNSISLSWSSIEYTEHKGGYEIYYSLSDNEFYTIYETTIDKTIEQVSISNLHPGTIYYFKIRTVTYPHTYGSWLDMHPNTVYSKFTPEISAKTLIYIPESERQALIDLYNSTDGDNWVNNTGWKGAVGTECNWYGVKCNNEKSYVIELDLDNNDEGNNLTGAIPQSIEDLMHLQKIDVCHNLINKLPSEIGNLTQLKHLYLFANDLTHLPAEIGNLTNLTYLTVCVNELTSLPPEIGNLTNLTTLYLHTAGLTSLPPEIGNLKNLTLLDLRWNQLTSILPEIGNLTNLTSFLKLSSNKLTHVPPEIGQLTKLMHLSLDSNELRNVPPEIGNLTNLTYLSLHLNKLTSLPTELGNLTNLHTLSLARNSLTTIPPEIGNLSQLEYLSLCGNKLSALPSEILNLNHLNTTYLGYNVLEIAVPEMINFLNTKQTDWQKTQTISPKNLTVTSQTEDTISLSWSSIEYTGHEGGYEVYYSPSDNQSYTIYDMTTDKTIAHMTISGLLSDTIYYFKVRTITYPHSSEQWYEENLNTVYSQFSTEISAKTRPLIATAKQSISGVLNSANINIEITGNGVDFYQYKLNQNAWSEDFSIDTNIILNNLEDGSYTLQIMGKNKIGSSQGSPSVYTWRVDTHVDNFTIYQSDWIDDSICLWALEPKNMTFSGSRESQATISIDCLFANDIVIFYPDDQTWQAQLASMPTGSYSIVFQAIDIVGNKKSIEKRIQLIVPESANIETQTDILLADNTQTLSMMLSFFTEDQAQICVNPNIRLESTMGNIVGESWLISNNQLTCLLKADSETGTARISAAFDQKELGSKTIEMVSGPLNRIVLYCDNPVQGVGLKSDLITMQLEDAYGHLVSVPYDMDIWIESTADDNGDFFYKGNNDWDWYNEFFVYSLKANKSSFEFRFRASISGNYILNATENKHDLTDSLAITVLDQPEIQFQTAASEISELTQWAEVVLKLSRITDQDVWVRYLTETDAENTATEGLDYELSPKLEIIIPAGESSVFIPLTIINDHIYELKELVTIRLVDSSISIGSKNVHTLYIIDDESPPSPPEITGPTSPTHTKSPEFCWASGGGSQTFRYKIDDPDLSLGAVETKSKCYELSYELAEGNHVFYIQEYNSPTNEWSATGMYSLEIDTGRPCSKAQSPPGIDAQHMQFEITYTYADIYSGEICGNPQNTGSGLKHIELWGMTPEDQAYTLLATDTDDLIDGKFDFTATADGPYRFFTRAIDQAGNIEPESDQEYDTETIYSNDFSGYAILAVGAIDGQKGLASHTFSANKIYRHLISRKFGMLYDLKDPLDHIKYFNPHHTELSGVDFFESNQKYPDALEDAITEWALDNICRLPGPLYIILIDHGGTNKFYLTGSNDWMDASDLNDWLTRLEDGLHQCTNDPITDIIIIIDTCYAGSFMNDLIKPDSTRIVITSTAENELSFRGPRSPSSELLVRDGAFFASNLFNELSKDINLAQSFENAVQRTEILSGSKSNKPRHPFLDHAAQHPLLDDNGIYPGHNQLYASGDGYRAKAITLGYGQFSTELPEIIETIIHANENSFKISVRINKPDDDLNVFVEIRTPDDKTPKTVNEQLQKEMDLMQINLVSESEGLFENTCDEFHTPGKYTLFFYLQDKNDIVYYLNQSYVYKSKANNNPPLAFQLISPKNLDDPENQGLDETQSFRAIFEWDETSDRERDQFSYTLWISKSKTFETDVIKHEDILHTLNVVELPDNWDGNDIFWKVEAIDEFGASVETEVFRFKLDDKNNLFEAPIVYFQVYDSETRLPVPGAKIWLDGIHPITTTQLGHLIQKVDLSDAIDLTITALTYETAYTKINAEDNTMISLAIPLVSNIQLGDINRDEIVDINDAILGLQLVGGMPVPGFYYDPPALILDNVGLADIIYVLRLMVDFDGK